MAERQAYLNGQWIDDRALAIPVEDPGFALGVTVTERLRTFGGRIWRQAEHVRRLRRSAQIVGIDPSVADEIAAAISEFMRRHEPLRAAAAANGVEDDWAIVAFATPGVGGVATRCVHGFPLPFSTWASQYESGVSVWTSDHRQTPGNCWPAELKCRSRMHYYLADQQARRLEPGARAILLDQDGYVGEASTANVVIYRDGEGIVSPLMSKVLPGVSVALLRELAEAEGVPFVERDLTIEEFRAADEAWMSSTSICLLPIVRCDGQPMGAGTPGPMYKRMLAAWSGVVGLDVAEQAQRRAEISRRLSAS
ncbi:D-alanine aminotransferase [Botrimarina colliarenosi]|uniref:branched-chain-amino-acid transaminase n=1 Tax=Botrimarina colliarenosi TaxID=2528001 RepID=A0A5C5ZZ54_9BACT|nr:aminotransferase class IV [Botrimarina colliarenosi]TWT92327.1 D-alanine aminotransferase [Botrimarina colliarenosi]